MRLILEGTGIDFQVEGPRTGLPLVLIHGFPFSKEMWRPQVEVLRKEHYVITYDVRGHGLSDPGDGQYSVEYFADDLLGLLDHLRISRVVACGLSMGGYIALRARERNPERFRALVLADTRSEADNNEGKIRRAAQARSIKADGMKSFAETFVKSVFCERTFHKNPGVVEMITGIMEKTSPLAAAGTLIALAARTDTTASLYSLTLPTLILVGQHDILTPPSAANAMREKIPGAALHIIPDAAHLSNLENPDAFNQHLLSFLAKVK